MPDSSDKILRRSTDEEFRLWLSQQKHPEERVHTTPENILFCFLTSLRWDLCLEGKNHSKWDWYMALDEKQNGRKFESYLEDFKDLKKAIPNLTEEEQRKVWFLFQFDTF